MFLFNKQNLLLVILGFACAHESYAGYSDAMPAPMFTRDQYYNPLSNQVRSQSLKKVRYFNPRQLNDNPYFTEAEKIVDEDKLRAAHWLISIIYENFEPVDEESAFLCADACRALVEVHLQNAAMQRHIDLKLNFMMYAALAADFGACVLRAHPGSANEMAADAYAIYYQVVNFAEKETHEDNRLNIVRRVLRDSDAEAITVQMRVNALRNIFSSSREELRSLHLRNLEHLCVVREIDSLLAIEQVALVNLSCTIYSESFMRRANLTDFLYYDARVAKAIVEKAPSDEIAFLIRERNRFKKLRSNL